MWGDEGRVRTLTSSDLDIVLVQETHWGSSGAWKHQGWSYFHSASEKPRQAGVLVGIRSDALDESRTAWREIVPGRLIWVRACVRGQERDLLSFYQLAQTGRDGETKDYRMKERRAVWNKLHRTLRGLPIRSLVVLGGDFNLSLEASSPVAGSGVLAAAGGREVREERAKVMDMLKELQMTALNTWSKPRPTYMHPTGNTQIDFIVVRRRNAHKLSKLTQPVDLDFQHGEAVDIGPLLHHFGPFGSLGGCDGLPSLRRDLRFLQVRRTSSVFGSRSRQHAWALLHDSGLGNLGRWAHRWSSTGRHARRCGRLPRSWTGYDLILFRAACNAHRAHRELKRHCRRREREQLLSCLLEAETAYRHGDSRAFFGFIRAVAPKQYLPQIKLRGKEGQLLTKDQEGGLLLEHVRKIFTGDGHGVPELMRVPEKLFCVQNWERSLREIKPHGCATGGGSDCSLATEHLRNCPDAL